MLTDRRHFARAICAALLAPLLPGLVCQSPAQSAPDTTLSDRPARIVDVRTIDPDSYRAVAMRVPEGEAPRIDGHLDEAVWQLAPVQGDFVQREPSFGAAASEKTEFRILYDDRHIYVGIWAWDSRPSGILASELKRDSGLRKGDQIKINFDTFHDHRNAFYFSTNPLGAYKDANSVENGRTINYDWNAVWNNRTSVDDHGWYVELAIPFSQLRFPRAIDEALWGLNICRVILRKNEEDYWVPFPREWGASGFARMSGAGVLAGLKGTTPRRRFEMLPYVLLMEVFHLLAEVMDRDEPRAIGLVRRVAAYLETQLALGREDLTTLIALSFVEEIIDDERLLRVVEATPAPLMHAEIREAKGWRKG